MTLTMMENMHLVCKYGNEQNVSCVFLSNCWLGRNDALGTHEPLGRSTSELSAWNATVYTAEVIANSDRSGGKTNTQELRISPQRVFDAHHSNVTYLSYIWSVCLYFTRIVDKSDQICSTLMLGRRWNIFLFIQRVKPLSVTDRPRNDTLPHVHCPLVTI